MSFILLYFLLMVLFFGIATALNYKHKWVTDSDLDNDPALFGLIILLSVLWPLTLIIGSMVGIGYLFKEYCIPKDPND